MTTRVGRVGAADQATQASPGAAEASPPFGEYPSRIASVARSIQHYLDHKLEGFSNGSVYPPSSPANKTNGYAAAKVPDWQLRQWLDAIATAQTPPESDQ